MEGMGGKDVGDYERCGAGFAHCAVERVSAHPGQITPAELEGRISIDSKF